MVAPTSSMLLSLILAFSICVTMIIVLKIVAQHIGLLDKPCSRKQHEGHVPLVGGIAMFIAFSISILLLMPVNESVILVSISCAVAALGVVDDMYGLQTWQRFFIQSVAAVSMVYFGGVQLVHLGNIFGDGVVFLGAIFSLIFTIFCVVGVINAMNMMDGMDGLAGSVLLMCFVALAAIAYSAGETELPVVLMVVVGSLLGFLVFNIQLFGYSARIFMGDAGSMFLGFLFAWFSIYLTQNGNQSLSPVAAGWIFGVPLLDASAVMVRRMLQGKSPFKAGRDHIHHFLLQKGYSVNKTLGIILSLQLVFFCIAAIANKNVNWEPALFWLFVIMVVTYLTYTHALIAEPGIFSEGRTAKTAVSLQDASNRSTRPKN